LRALDGNERARVGAVFVSMASDGRLLSLQASEWLMLIADGMAGSLILMALWLRSARPID